MASGHEEGRGLVLLRGTSISPSSSFPTSSSSTACGAVYSIGQSDKFLFWLTQDKDGKPWIARGAGLFGREDFHLRNGQ
jgi:hypothetical protein